MKHKPILLVFLTTVIISLTIFIFWNLDYLKNFFSMFKNIENLNNFLHSFGYLAWLVYFLLQIFQVVIFVIPGELIQAAGGYMFGTYMGTLLSFGGIAIGSSLLFIVCHKYGRNFVKKFISPELHNKFIRIINSRDKRFIIFVLYLIPGIPKDSLVMICALTDIDLKNFITFSMIGRLPALFLSTYLGANIAEKEYLKAIILSILFAIFLFIVLMFKEKILNKLSKKEW